MGTKELYVPEKTDTFFRFGLKHQHEMELLREFGQLKGLTRQDLGHLQGGERTYRNIAEHNSVVGLATGLILEEAVRKNKLSSADRDRGEKGGLLHDLLNRDMIELTYGRALGGQKEFIDPTLRKRIAEELLDAHNLSQGDKENYALAEFTGDGCFRVNAEEVNITKSPDDLIKWTIFLVDYMVAHDKLVSSEERIQEIIGRNEYNAGFAWYYKQWFSEAAYEQICREPDSSRKVAEVYYDKTRVYIHEVENQLHDLLEIAPDVSILDFINQKLNERYEIMKTPRIPKELAIMRTLLPDLKEAVDRNFGKRKGVLKTDQSIATEGDISVDRIIRQAIEAHFPQDAILSEEATEKSGTGRVWVIDPICGTDNYDAGIPHYCTNIALWENGTPVFAMVIDYPQNRFYWASAGNEGVYDENHTRVNPVLSNRSNKNLIIDSGKLVALNPERISAFCNIQRELTEQKYAVLAMGSSLSWAGAAFGLYGGLIVGDTKPWDAAASVYLIQKQGGIVTDMFGNPWQLSSANVVGSVDKNIHANLLQIVKAHWSK